MPAVPAALPLEEDIRLEVLRKHAILDTAPERAFDRITELAQRVFDVPMVLVSLVDEHRQWFKSCIGVGAGETGRDVSFCAHAILHPKEAFVIHDATQDERFATNPLVLGPPYVRFYAGAPLVSGGQPIGTLCIIDTKSRTFDRPQQQTLMDLGAMAVEVLELRLVKGEIEDQGRALMVALREGERDRKALAYQTAILRSVVDSAAEGIIVVDEKGKFQFFSSTAKSILGMEPHAEPYTTFRTSYETMLTDEVTPCPPEDRPLSRAMRGESCDDVELFLRRTDGTGVFLSLSGRPLRDHDGRLRGGVVTMRDISEIRRVREELARQATTDGLTGLWNKRSFDDRLAQLVAESERGRSFAVVLIDVDHFKKVNDTHGHPVGDRVLVAIAKALRSRLRKTDFVARVGGEELCVLLVDVTPERAVKVAEDLRRAVQSADSPVAVTASFGVCATGAVTEKTASRMLKAADDALYQAKRSGRDRVVLHEPVVAGGAIETG